MDKIDYDIFFHDFMLPGTGILLFIFSAVLITLFLIRPKPLQARSGQHFFMNRIQQLNPAYFALVMSTGIVSIAAHLQGLNIVATTLLGFNIVAYPVLWAMYICRMVWFSQNFKNDFLDHTLGMGYFTAVAASGVLGSQVVMLFNSFFIAAALWCITISLWLCLIYGIFTGFITKREKPTIDRGINGGWLLAIVATQAVAVLSTTLAPFFEYYLEPVLFLAFVTWLFGGMLYIWVISLIFYRYLFFAFSPEDLTPPYWINMGAVAITTLAGTGLIANADSSSFLIELGPFLTGLTWFFWATATWWIPMLVILGVWRHGYRRFPLGYSPLFWGAVFPLGMYTACTHRLSEVTGVELIGIIPKGFVYIALAAWLITLGGMVHAVFTGLGQSRMKDF
ncbi:MAG: tellurite resistance/C4-dicarboxylate transporter family protein [Desulfobacterium sp.]|nr:tellurite resistance/C4-dicarboxylate transporter family protein [Desulfobacterium sp.]